MFIDDLDKEVNRAIEELSDEYEIELRENIAKKLDLRYVGAFYDGFARVQLPDGNWTFVNKKGVLIEEKFKYASHFYEGLAKVVGVNMYCIDHKGRIVFQID